MTKRPRPAQSRPAADQPRRPHRPTPLGPPEELFDRTKARVGRPCKLDRQVIADAVHLLERGMFLTSVAAAIGIHRETFYDWLSKGRAEPPHSPLHREFSDACDVASGMAEALTVIRWQEGPSKDWRRHALFAQRRWPERFGQRVAITGAEGAAPQAVQVYGVRLPLPKDEDDG